MKFSRPVIVPLILLIYLGIMSIIGLPELKAGHYLYYFGVIGFSLCCIIALHFFLKKRQQLKNEREKDNVNKH